jgi:hypothetical protein
MNYNLNYERDELMAMLSQMTTRQIRRMCYDRFIPICDELDTREDMVQCLMDWRDDHMETDEWQLKMNDTLELLNSAFFNYRRNVLGCELVYSTQPNVWDLTLGDAVQENNCKTFQEYLQTFKTDFDQERLCELEQVENIEG